VYGGHGLSRLDGRVVLTPLVLPGEQITAEPVDKLHARLVRVDTPAPERVPAPCPYFGICGGCHYQHAPYQFQVQQKVAILREVLRRVGKMEAPEQIRVLAGEPWAYRNRTQLRVRNGKLGYLRMGSHELCPVDHCPISSPKLNEAIAALTGLIQDRRWPPFIRAVEFFTNETDVQFNVIETEKPLAKHFFEWCAERIPGYAAGSIEYAAGGETFRVGPRSFFQVNRYLLDPLAQEATAAAEGSSVLDLYAGAGLFTIPLARRFERVTAVESGAAAVADLRYNAERAGVAVEAVRAEASEYLTGLDRAPDWVVADPTREGLGKSAVRELVRLRPQGITVVACDPATLARDLAAFVAGGYRLESMTMIDLFPQTYHLETVVTLRAS
jgi:23S rRNA (uracil1939-C5)-methyltransferase